MKDNPLKTLSMAKYVCLLPRVFPGCDALELRSNRGDLIWSWPEHEGAEPARESDNLVAWGDISNGLGRRNMPDGRSQYRSALITRDKDTIGWLVVCYNTAVSVPMDTAPESLRRAFADAIGLMQEEIELRSECDQLALELTERYEELNLMYVTEDRVEHFEEGQQALVQLVHNCADYLDVGMAALICRDRNLEILELNRNDAPVDPEHIMGLLRTGIYDRVESQVSAVVLNELDKRQRRELLGKRSENLIAYPIIDDFAVTIGILAIVARRELHTFSNGDRNLLDVMAKKASRIIHTHHDALTGLINRSGFESKLVKTLGNARSTNDEHCVLHIDIDQLHVVNDLMGFQEGDALIRRVSHAIRKRLRDTDCLARLGGDEFGILLTQCPLDKAYEIGKDVCGAIRKIDVVAANRQLDVSASIGIANMNGETDGIVGLLASAEIACKAAKESGRDSIQVYERDNTTLVRRSEEIEWLGRIQTALRDDGFELYAQPVTPISDSSRAEHFEILLRMRGDDGEILSPAVFLPAAERYQMMPMVDRWVIRNSLRRLATQWANIEAQRPTFCINLSGQSLTNAGFFTFIEDELAATVVPAKNICFEITETAAIANIDEAIVMMNTLREGGCRFSLDDFGAGLSSFGYLKKLPVDYLKVDGSFIRNITTDKVSQSMVHAICGIGQTMGLSIVAEYVSDENTVALLRDIGVDFAQGFGTGKPVPLEDAIRTLKDMRGSQLA